MKNNTTTTNRFNLQNQISDDDNASLTLLHSDLSTLRHQIDELVVKAWKMILQEAFPEKNRATRAMQLTDYASLAIHCVNRTKASNSFLNPKGSTTNGNEFVGELWKRRTSNTNEFFRRDRNRRLIRHVTWETESCCCLQKRFVPVFRRSSKRRKQVQSIW